MQIIPALYLQNGNCVSWYKGADGPQTKTYPISPIEAASQFEWQGAKRLHCIDLEGSQNNAPTQTALLHNIAKHVKIPIEVGGGIRTLEDIETLFSLGISRVILGVSAQGIIPQALKKYGSDQIVLGLKARRETIESESFAPESKEVLEIAEEMVKKGITQIIYKDLEREGTLYHPNYDEIDRLIMGLKSTHGAKRSAPIQIFSSGGVVALDDLSILESIGTDGVILSRALFEKRMNLNQAIEQFQKRIDKKEKK